MLGTVLSCTGLGSSNENHEGFFRFLTKTETMAIAGAFSRSVLRSTSFRNAAAAARVTSEAKAKTSPSSPFRLSSNQKPLSHRIFNSPVELSCCVDSLMPFHSANSSAILISKLGVSLRAYHWLLQACYDDA